MFTIWQEHTAKVKEFKSVFNTLAYMQENEVRGKVKDIAGKTIVSWSSKSHQPDWHIPSQLTTEDAAFLLGRSLARINQFCNAGRMGHKFGRQWAITLEELEKFAAQERLSGVGFNQNVRKKETEKND